MRRLYNTSLRKFFIVTGVPVAKCPVLYRLPDNSISEQKYVENKVSNAFKIQK